MTVEFDQITVDFQQQVNSALEKINSARILRKDGTEYVLSQKYEEVRQELLRIFYDIPKGIRCLSVNVTIPSCPEELITEIDYLNRNLRNLLAPLSESASDFTRSHAFSFVIIPPLRPEELKNLRFGSRARDLSEEVIETLIFEVKGDIVLLTINPLGEPKTSASRNLNALTFPVPLRFVQSVTLEKEEKPLTPYLERNKDGSLVVHTINYS